jgi:hypothetical protein
LAFAAVYAVLCLLPLANAPDPVHRALY